MAQEEEEDEESLSDIPSFDDLVEEIETQETDSEEENRSEESPKSAVTAASGSGGMEPAADRDDTDWNWGGLTSDDVGETSSGDETSVDALWGEPIAGPDSDSGDEFDAPKAEALLELIGDASNVLLVGPAGIPIADDICSQLSDIETNGPRRRLLVTTEQTPDERLDALRPYTDEPFDETAVVVVGDLVRSNDSPEPSTHHVGEETVFIETLHDPMDLTRLGILNNKYLGKGESPPVLCFHTLNGILQFVEIEKLFRFLHVLQARVRSVGGRAHYQIDPQTADESSITTLKPLFDFTIRYDENGSISVDTRS